MAGPTPVPPHAALLEIFERGARVGGRAFREALLLGFGRELASTFVALFVAERDPGHGFTLEAGFRSGTPLEAFPYTLVDGPCGTLDGDRDVAYIPEHSMELFPMDVCVRRFRLGAYFARLLRGSDGRLLGILVAGHEDAFAPGVDPISAIRPWGAALEMELDRARAVQAAEERSVQLAALADRGETAFFSWEPSHGVREMRWSRSVERVLGVTREQLRQDDTLLYSLLHEDDQSQLLDQLERLQAGERLQVQQEFRVKLAGGGERWLELRAAIPHRGQRCAGVIVDLSSRRRLEQQLLRAQKLESVGQLAGGVAHDFNNLLTIVLSYTHMGLQRHGESPELAGLFRPIRDAAERGARLARQLLTYARRQPSDIPRTELAVELESLALLLGRVIGEHIQLSVEVAPEAGVAAIDPSHLEQVLLNLVVNARDAMTDGGTLRITVRPWPGSPEWAPPRSSGIPGVLIQVEDNGVGMTEEVRRRAFEAFFSTKPADAGTGLGLASCQTIIQGAGGTIALESTQGVGTVVSIWVPQAVPGVPRRVSISHPPAEADGRSLLLVEDEALLRRGLQRSLVKHGYLVEVAEDGRAAVEILERQGGAYDLLVTDLMLPRMGGRELTEFVRRRWPSLPVLWISGYFEGELQPSDPRLLRKPFAPEELLQAVDETIRAATDG